MNAHAAWDPSGVNVTQPVAKRFDHYPHVVTDGQGGAIVAWDTEDDLVTYDLDVAACRVSFEGDVLWSAIVSTEAGYQMGSAIVEDGVGGAIVVWFDERTTAPGMGIYAQRYNDAGVAQWSPNGIRVTSFVPLLAPPLVGIRVVSDGEEGAFVVWTYSFGEIYAQRVTAIGTLPWSTLGLPVTLGGSFDKSMCDAASDGSGGLLVTWARDGVSYDIIAQRMDLVGGLLWGNNGVAITSDLDDQQFPHIVPTSSGGAVVVWDQPAPLSTEVYAQRLDGAGVPQWTSGGVSASGAVNVTEGSARLIGDGGDGAFVVWSDNRNDPAAADLFAVHVPATGMAGAHKALTAPTSRVEDASIVSDGAGGSFVTWRLHDTIGGPQVDLVYCQWLDSDLANLLVNGGELLYDIAAGQFYPQTLLASPGKFIVVWEDTRDEPSFTDCYARLVEGNTAEGTDVTITPVDQTTGTTPASVRFSEVTSQGATSLSTGPVGPPLPGTFQSTGIFYHITTTATFAGTVEICITYDPLLVVGPESSVSLMHFDGAWANVTTSLDTLFNVVCGTTTSLSPFAVGVSIATGVGDGARRFALHQNVPNPFNPTTIVAFDVPLDGADVHVSIYDPAGRLVRELVNQRYDAGSWSAQWNGEDSKGRRVASGVYFYRMRAGSFVDTKKMVLLK
jgi:flagellar hook assembly protein FlgD